MAEEKTIDPTLPEPVTLTSLIRDFQDIGIIRGSTLLVHSSLSSIGWVVGGAQTVLLALEHVLGPTGTLVMPTHTANLSDPAEWENPPVPSAWWPIIRNEMPTFDRGLSPTWGMGKIPELFRTQEGTLRSSHPNGSFAARGPNAKTILQDNKLDFMMDHQSPLGRLYDLGASVLLLGVGYDRNTCFHLGEYEAEWPGKIQVPCGAPVAQPFFAKRTWAEYQDINFQDDFSSIGEAFEAEEQIKSRSIGTASSKLFPIQSAVDFAISWIQVFRKS